jgi:glycosyltransferase involved in cell wall biosynthesis/tetratricopeptide (TPR) repeat protein
MSAARFFVVDPSLRDFVGHHFEYDAATLAGARAYGFEAHCLAHRAATLAISAELKLKSVFTYDIWGAPPGVGDPTKRTNDIFFQELVRSLPPGSLRADDIVFGHMLTSRQLGGWARFAQRLRPGGPQLILLLRYEAHRYDHPIAAEAFAILRRARADGVRIRLASDSARLADQLEALGGLPVEVLPIPHTGHAVPRAAKPKAGRPLNVVSLGNARDEKGILEIFDAIRVLNREGRGEAFRFVLQVNDATPDLQPAIDVFAAERHRNVELHVHALSSDAYYAILQDADLVALPYWRSIYEARTSGVLLEAKAAAKVVICTDGTWMSDQIEATGGGVVVADRNPAALANALLAAEARYEELASQALIGAGRWLAYHNGDSLIGQMIAPPAVEMRRRPVRAAVFYPWGDGHRRASGASQRLGSLVDLLGQRVDEVRVLQDAEEPSVHRGHAVIESTAVLGRALRRGSFQALRLLARLFGARKGEEIYLLLALAAATDKELSARIDERVRNADFVFLEYPFWAPLVDEAARRHGRDWVLTAHDVLADQVKHSAGWVRRATAWMERRALALAPHLVTLSDADTAHFESWGLRAQTIGIGLDVQLLRPLPGDVRPLLTAECGIHADQATILLFVGSRYGPNQIAAAALKQIAAAYDQVRSAPPVRIVVAGACAEAGRDGSYVALGPVDDVTLRLLYQCAGLVLAPMEVGTGASVKAAEALASGVPMLSTELGIRGLSADARAGVAIENDLAAWPDAIARLVSDPARMAELKAAAEQTAGRLDIRVKLAPYLDLLPGLAERPVASPAVHEGHMERVLDAARLATQHRLPSLAEELLTFVRERQGLSPQLLLEYARLQASKGRAGAKAALELLDEALREGGDAFACLRLKAEIQRASGAAAAARLTQAEAARELANQIVTPQGAARGRDEMWRAFHEGDRIWAFLVAEETLTRWPTLATGDHFYLAALVVQERGEGDAATLAWAEQAVARGFNVFWGWRLVAILQTALGDEAAAKAAFLKAAPGAETDEHRRIVADGLMHLGWQAFNAGRYEDARHLAIEAAKASPNIAAAPYVIAETRRLAGAQAKELLPHYRRARALGFDAVWCDVHIGRLSIAGKERDLGWEMLAAVLADPDAGPQPKATALDGMAQRVADLKGRGRAARACDELEAVLARRPDLVAVRIQLAGTLAAAGKVAAGVEAYRQAEADGWDAFDARHRAAEALVTLRQGSAPTTEEIEQRIAAAQIARRASQRDAVLEAVRAELWRRRSSGDAEAVAWLEERLRTIGVSFKAPTVEEVRRAAKQGRLGFVLHALLDTDLPLNLPEIVRHAVALRAVAEQGVEFSPRRLEALAKLVGGVSEADGPSARILFDLAVLAHARSGSAALSAQDPVNGLLAYADAEVRRLRGEAWPQLDAGYDAAVRLGADPVLVTKGRLLALSLEPADASQASVLIGPSFHPSLDLCAPAEADRIESFAKAVAWKAFLGGEAQPALDLAEQILVRQKRDAPMVYVAAEALQVLDRDLARAERLYGQAKKLGFNAYWVHFNRAQARVKLGRYSQAIEDLEAAIAAAPDADAASRARDSLEHHRARAPV